MGRQGKPDGYNAVGAGQMMKLGANTSEAVGKPGASNAIKAPGAWGMGGGWEMTRPGSYESVKPSGGMSDDANGGFARPGGAESIRG